METAVRVYVDLDGEPMLAGRLWARSRRGRETASFEYDPDWLVRRDRFALQPALPPALAPGPGQFQTAPGRALFAALSDSAPDRWGRVLMRRAERRRAERAGETPRTLREIDYLLLVNDAARQGALRFATDPEGPFLAAGDSATIPPLVDLPRLLSAADHVDDARDSDEDLRLLLAPGSSLGGARPKASVLDHDGHLAIAKFPHSNDEIDVMRWEAVALALATSAGIEVAAHRLELVAGRPVLVLRRFDRGTGARIPFLSAMSMLDAQDNERRSYLEFVDVLRQHGAAPVEDMHALWRRIVFMILISNTDDHLRNHGFLYDGLAGWRLSPAYDLNPVPTDISPRNLTTGITDQDDRASLEVAMEAAEYFDLSREEARVIAGEVGQAVGNWRAVAGRLGIPEGGINRMASAFEHQDLDQACACDARS